MDNIFPAQKRTRNFILTICLFAVCLILGKLFSYSTLYMISSSSMEPKYPVYSLVVVKKEPFSKLKTGDVIVYKSNALRGGLAFHRVTKVVDGGVYAKGDKNLYEDNQLITSNDYVGKEAYSITFFAKLLALKKPSGIFVFLILPSLSVFLVYTSVKLLKKTENKEEQ